ncbi:hypothetical protein CROQUDRAFT_666834 [Cronartium quercuum f. sp. fusiforme G11]|uniref:UDENN domain-containing protein n=1 Tax=Cronartium quercuum f. sp. fusiforme G11 TaxID=708437 RepID=A0A9P6N5H8_9BASI|nr:hypothetical protein CROQUDRAFT_666834 [Cronartium quercuum f. sp. fusiforme G11]
MSSGPFIAPQPTIHRSSASFSTVRSNPISTEPLCPRTPPSFISDSTLSSPQSHPIKGPHAAFVLLAEFDIDTGSGVKHQYPRPTGTSEHLLADLMLPDGAHDRTEDWTVFFLNQTPRLTIEKDALINKPNEFGTQETGLDQPGKDPIGAPPTPRLTPAFEKDDQLPDYNENKLLYVISLVRTKKDNTVRRGAICKAMAVCSPHPYIQIFKPILLLALEDYFVNPSIDCLAQLYHALNTMETSGMPRLTHFERIVLRCSERPDMFEEKFTPSMTRDSSEVLPPYVFNINNPANLASLSTPPLPTSATMGRRLSGPTTYTPPMPSALKSFDQTSTHSLTSLNRSSSGSNDSLTQEGRTAGPPNSHTRRPNNLVIRSDEAHQILTPPLPSSTFGGSLNGATPPRRPKDTHFYDTKINYGSKSIPVRIPLQTFPEEVGEYSLIQLVQTFSSPNALTYNSPLHPHLHTSGTATHPIILLFNALVTQKRIIFLGHGLPAGIVSQMVLAACALGSGCGGILEGFTARAFPYSNLTIYDDFKAVPGYIAGVTNPIFELHTEAWDVFCNIETGKITVSKDITMPLQTFRSFSPVPPERTMTEVGTASTGLLGSLSSTNMKGGMATEDNPKPGAVAGGPVLPNAGLMGTKQDSVRESVDQVFMDDIIGAITSHFGEPIIRARFTDYVRRFVRVASRWEEEHLGSSFIGVKTKTFTIPSAYLNTNTLEEKIEMLGSGPVFPDEQYLKRELASNAPRIEAWRETRSYRLYRQRHARGSLTNFSFDVPHQLSRLRVSRKIPEVEVQAMYEVLVAKVQTHHEIVEILSHTPPYLGGLSPFTFGLFHASERIRNLSVEFIRRIESHPTGQKFFQGLNSFPKLAYQRLAHYLYKRSSSIAYDHSGGEYVGLADQSLTEKSSGNSNGFVIYEDQT